MATAFSKLQVLSNAKLDKSNDSDNRASDELLNTNLKNFNDTSKKLAESYMALEKRVMHLKSDLKQQEMAHLSEKIEKDRLESRMQVLLDCLPGGVIILDENGFVVEANRAAKQLLDSELEEKLWRDVIRDRFAPRDDDGFEVSTKTGKRISLSTESLGEQGQIILLTDQTETRRLQKNLSRYEKFSAMGKMVSALAHQIRTPLSAAMLYAGHLCNSNIDSDKKDLFSKKLYGRLQHMEKQVRDMMLFVKSELPLNDYVSIKNIEDGLRQAAELPLITSLSESEWHNHCPDVSIKCNREALINAVMNLVNNAIQASESHAEINIGFSVCEEKQGYIQISVSDSGPGMTDAELQSAKEMFYTTKGQGTGLGITVVYSVAKAHGGSVVINSEKGKGTEAVMVLPIAES